MLDELEQILCKNTANSSEYAETINVVRHRFGTLLQGKNGDTSKWTAEGRGQLTRDI